MSFLVRGEGDFFRRGMTCEGVESINNHYVTYNLECLIRENMVFSSFIVCISEKKRSSLLSSLILPSERGDFLRHFLDEFYPC